MYKLTYVVESAIQYVRLSATFEDIAHILFMVCALCTRLCVLSPTGRARGSAVGARLLYEAC
jgi:hypothetical protein